MYRYRKRLWICEECGDKVEFLGLKNGKHVCGKCSNKSNRDLRLVEKVGIKIQRKDGTGIVFVIRGVCERSAMYPKSGFIVSDIDYKSPFPAILPFDKIKEYEVLEDD